jgi:hypothetical protein
MLLRKDEKKIAGLASGRKGMQKYLRRRSNSNRR